MARILLSAFLAIVVLRDLAAFCIYVTKARPERSWQHISRVMTVASIACTAVVAAQVLP